MLLRGLLRPGGPRLLEHLGTAVGRVRPLTSGTSIRISGSQRWTTSTGEVFSGEVAEADLAENGGGVLTHTRRWWQVGQPGAQN